MISGSDKINEFPDHFNKLEKRIDVLEARIAKLEQEKEVTGAAKK